MALSTHVTDRFGSNTPFLRNLTNHDDPDASTVNTTRLGKACDAVEADFPRFAQTAYDDTSDLHVNVAVMGVIAYLRAWSSQQGPVKGAFDEFKEALGSIRSIEAGKRIQPTQIDRRDPDYTLFDGLSPEPIDPEEDD